MGLTIGIAGSLLCDKGGPDDCRQGFANSIRSFFWRGEALEQTGGESSWGQREASGVNVLVTVSKRWVRLN